MTTEEKEILFKLINQIKNKKVDENKEVKNFIKKKYRKEKFSELTKKEKYALLNYMENL